VHVHDTETFAEVLKLEAQSAGGSQKPITCMAVSADGSKVASGDNHRYVYVHDAASREECGKFAHHSQGILSISLSSDGNMMSTVGNDMCFGLVDLQSGKHIKEKEGHGRKIIQMTTMLHDGRVATTGDDCAIRLWNLTVPE